MPKEMSRENIEGFLRQAKHDMDTANRCGYDENVIRDYIHDRLKREQFDYVREKLATKGPADLLAILNYLNNPPALEVKPLTPKQEVVNAPQKNAKGKKRGRPPKRSVVEGPSSSESLSQG